MFPCGSDMSERFIRFPVSVFLLLGCGLLSARTADLSTEAPVVSDPTVAIVENARPGTVRIEAHMPLENRMGTFGKALKKRLRATEASGSRRWYVSMGSGVIWHEKGYVVTTLSIVRNASKIKVHCFDGSAFDAKPVGSDDVTNLAVLRIVNAADHEFQPIARRNQTLPEGSWLVLLGYGYGGIPTVSRGLAGIPPEHYDSGRH